ncbi:MAG: hypothetical protein MAG431_01306 [Chloroflexi bacterium]|nr:hypothetical protein [Chloroflexota bacterium]
MSRKQILSTIIFLVLLTLSCVTGVEVPVTTEPKTGDTITETIDVPAPAEAEAIVTLSFGAGKLNLLPSTGDSLLSGTATYNVEDFKPEITVTDKTVTIKQGNIKLDSVPTINKKVKNEWDLALSNHPVDLTVKAGAYKGDYELGGLAITNLHIADGAATVELSFTMPNLVTMNSFRYETGASDITLNNLNNANFQTMIFQGGGGNYNLDFSGTLWQDASVFIETGLSRIVITVPKGVPAEARLEGALTQVNIKGDWQEAEEMYSQPGQGPKLTLNIETSAGSVTLRNP